MEASPTRAITERDASTLFTMFGFAWAFQALEEKSDRLNPADWTSLDSASDLLVIATAIALLCRPGSPRLLLLFGSTALVNTAIELPHIMNHLVIAACLNVVIVVQLGRAWLRGGLPTGDAAAALRTELLRVLSPCAQVCVVLLYAFAFFHKLNWDFVDLTSTCVAYSYYHVQMIVPGLPTLSDSVLVAGIAITYAVEGLLPLGLVVRRTRYLALIVGLGFHLLLGSYVPSFTILLFSLYLFFLPPELLARMARRVEQVQGSGLHAGRVATALALGLVATWYGLFLLPPIPAIHWMRWLWLAVGGSTALGFVLLARSVVAPPAPFAPLLPHSTLAWAMIALVFVNGLAPYLGLKTGVAFAMYSNLRTEGESNHMLVPKGALQVVDWQDDLVEIVSSGSRRFYEKRGLLLPRIELRRELQLEPAAVAMRVRYRGEVIASDDMRSHPLFGAPLAWPLAKTLIFRPVAPAGGGRCFW